MILYTNALIVIYAVFFSYALTLRLMLANLRRKVGLATHTHTPQPMNAAPTDGNLVVPSSFVDGPLPPLTMEELGFAWPSDGGIFSPSSIPVWLQEQVRGPAFFLRECPHSTRLVRASAI